MTDVKEQNRKSTKEKIVRAALALASEKEWQKITLQEIANQAELSLAELYEYCDDKFDILAAYGRLIDRQVLAEDRSGDEILTARERLFDLLMSRFDVLNQDKKAVQSILRAFRYDPKNAAISLPHLGRSMVWMCEAAGISPQGIKGAATIAALTGLYLRTLWVWQTDDSADMAETMAALDKYLERAERWAERAGF